MNRSTQKKVAEEMQVERVMNHLASMPGLAHSAVLRHVVTAIMLKTGGDMMLRGELWDLTSRPLGGGICRVSTKRHEFENGAR